MWYNNLEMTIMYAAINGVGNNKSVYIMQSFRKKDGKTSTKVYRKLGSLNDLLPCFSNNQELLMAQAKKEAKKDTDEYNAQYGAVSFSLHRLLISRKMRNVLSISDICFYSSYVQNYVSMIVTYSPKYKAYQRKIRNRQIERAEKMITRSEKKRKGKSPNDPARFIRKTSVTSDGEIADECIYSLDQDKVADEARYDGFYAVITNMNCDVDEIIRINQQRWEIEESFRIMKTEFEERPVYVRREDRIKAHFLTCYLSLLIYRLLEKKLDDKYTCNALLTTLRAMQVTLLPGNLEYTPSYKRTDLTDDLHDHFDFRTDLEFISKSRMRTIIKNTKNLQKSAR